MVRILLIIAISLVIFLFSTRGCFLFNRKVSLYEQSPDTEKLLENHVKELSETIGIRSMDNIENLEKAAKYIQENLEKSGYEIKLQFYKPENEENKVKNIIAYKTGTDMSEETVLIGAHYDSCYNPGADDNASAIAALLELARQLRDVPLKHPVQFVAFVNEEPPYFKSDDMGSFVYAKEAHSLNKKFKLVMILEMLGFYSDENGSQSYPPPIGVFYPNRGNFIAFVSNFKSSIITGKAIKRFKRSTDFPVRMLAAPSFIPGVDFSDHWSFWKHGYKAFMVTDTAFYRNDNYHTDTDTYDTLNYAYMNEVIRGLKEVIISSANEE